MPSILKEISEWASTLPYWEQAALEKIVAGVEITDETLEQLLNYLLEDAGLEPRKASRPTLKFSQAVERDDSERHDMVRLRRIANLRNINALVPDQTLEFCDKLTVIFGANGSGKSGYARVIASAAFTRGDKQILPDITKPQVSHEPLSALLELEIEGEPVKIQHEIGQVCAEMRSFYVFDSTSVRAHLTHSNPMSFSPAGLEILTRLVEVTDGVRSRLQQRVDQMRCSNPFPLRFSGGESEVSRMIDALGAKSNLDEIRRLGTLSEVEIGHIREMDLEIARLKSENVPEKIRELEQTIADLIELAEKLQVIGDAVSDERAARVQDAVQERASASRAVKEIGIGQFRNPWFRQTGSPMWYEFIQSAQYLANAEEKGNSIYPESGDRCLLCLQPLNDDAHNRMHSLWEFLKSDAQRRLDKAKQTLYACIAPAQSLNLDILSKQAVSYRHLQAKDRDALERARLFLHSAERRRDALTRLLKEDQIGNLTPLPENPVHDIERITGRLEAEREALVARKVDEEIKHLEQAMLELEHRKLLGEVLGDVVQYVENAIWIERASSSKVKRSSGHISSKYNKMFDQLVTQEYLRLFQETLKKLNCPLLVKIDTKAQKGTTIKQIMLQTDASVVPGQAPPEKVLSEGEQRAVALADFFTEVRLDKHSCGVVLDDPVTSLDFQWKETISDYIAEEAIRQQVIVFTHDLHFLYLLKKISENANLLIQAHWIERRDHRPGWVFINNSPLSEREYKTSKIPREIYASAKDPKLPSGEQQRLLREGFGALRTCYEAFVMYDLFNGVVVRFEERTHVDQLSKVVIDPGIRDTAVEKMGLMSRYIEGHLHSDAYVAQKPSPDMLLKEITDFEELKQRHREFKKSQGIKN